MAKSNRQPVIQPPVATPQASTIKDHYPSTLPLKRGGKPRKARHVVQPRPSGPHDVDDLPTMVEPSDEQSDWEEEHVDWIGPTIDKYMEAHSHRTPGTAYAFETCINDFLTLTGLHENMRLHRINREACQRWKAHLLNGVPNPRNKNKRPRKSITIQIMLKNFSHFTRWLVAQDYRGFESDPMRGLLLNARMVSDSQVSKEPFTDTEMELILADLHKGAPYDTAKDELRKNYYWLVLCVMHTGARLGEILHMKKAAVHEVNGIWCFELVPREGRKKLKTKQSTRRVPIRRQLLEAGFLDYFHSCTGPLLFPELEGPDVPTASRWFTARLKVLGIKRDENSCHSLRHSMVVRLAQMKVHRDVRHRLLGHAFGSSEEDTNYMKTLDFPVEELKEAIDMAVYPPIPMSSHRFPK